MRNLPGHLIARLLPRLFALLLVMLQGCADLVAQAQVDSAEPPAGEGGPVVILHSRAVSGGFLAPTPPAVSQQARPGTGMFVRFQAPGVLALLGQEMLVAELMSGRVWRADLGFNTLSPIAAAPVTPGMALMLGPDYSAWVLDTAAGQVLRFDRSGRTLLRTVRAGFVAPAPTSMALVDGGATLLLSDAALGQWAELRGDGSLALPVRPHHPDHTPLPAVSAIAAWRDQIYVLDALAGAVYRVERDGAIVETLPGRVDQASAMAVDRHQRVYVLDALGRHVTVLRRGAEPELLSAAQLGVQQIGGLAVDGAQLAVSDRLSGQVLVHTLATEPRP